MAVPAVPRILPQFLTIRAVLRTVLVVVAVALTLVLIYMLRKPLTWIFIAGSSRSRCRDRSTCCSGA